MKFHGVNVVGKLHVQRVPTLPSFDSSLTSDGKPKDEGRMLYVEDEQMLYYGTSTGWSGSPVLIDQSLYKNSSPNYGKKYRLIVLEGTLQLQEIVTT